MKAQSKRRTIAIDFAETVVLSDLPDLTRLLKRRCLNICRLPEYTPVKKIEVVRILVHHKTKNIAHWAIKLTMGERRVRYFVAGTFREGDKRNVPFDIFWKWVGFDNSRSSFRRSVSTPFPVYAS